MTKHYDGTMIIPDSSFLRRLPAVLDTEQVFILDALVFSADVMTCAFAELKALATEVGRNADQMSNLFRANLLSVAWSIVDQLYAARKMIEKFPNGLGVDPGSLANEFMVISAPAAVLRNGMDHLHDNMGNRAKLKRSQPPLFGSLAFFLTGPDPATGGSVVTIMAGQSRGTVKWPVLNPAGRERIQPPADHFELTAFGETLPLGPPIEAYRQCMNAMEKQIEGDFRSRLPRLSAEYGITEDKLLDPAGVGLTIVMEVSFHPPLEMVKPPAPLPPPGRSAAGS